MEAVSFLNLHFIEMSITSREEPVKQLWKLIRKIITKTDFTEWFISNDS